MPEETAKGSCGHGSAPEAQLRWWGLDLPCPPALLPLLSPRSSISCKVCPLMGGMGEGGDSRLCLLLFPNFNDFFFSAEWCFVSKIRMREIGMEWGRG